MPYPVWLRFVPLLMQIEKDGELESWHAGPLKRK